MFGMHCCEYRHFLHGWNVLWSTRLVSAWLDYVVIKIASFSMSGMCGGQNHILQHVWNVLWSKKLVSAWLECVVVKINKTTLAQKREI
jgi:hypothetical protein